jgi:hypothetical protein
MTLCLTAEEIEAVTDKKWHSAQLRVLRAPGIEAKPRPDGSILVDRAVYDEWARGDSRDRRSHRSDASERKTYPVWGS